ncbi:hypothetical protein F5B19DRAFT_269997 [Rostrohypoxylon terebratum]|nr:hypothetical protein F5B19DRAFT_269997 [Rostrohypoxylon terebratum]
MVNAIGTFFIVVLVLAVAGSIGWVVFTQLRARRLGLPAPPISSYNPFRRSEPSPYAGPQPAPGGIRGWVSDKWRALRGGGTGGGGSRSATGAGYERASRRGYGLDPDDAWDTRVGHEADAYYGYGAYEEQELGLRGQHQQHSQQQQPQNPFQSHGDIGAAGGGAYSGAGYSNVTLGADEQRGRTLSRSPGVGLGVEAGRNPFDDDAAEPSNISLRGVSPRPIDTGVANAAKAKGGVAHHHDSPTSERRSIFREDV